MREREFGKWVYHVVHGESWKYKLEQLTDIPKVLPGYLLLAFWC
jgi:hypothetical protein